MMQEIKTGVVRVDLILVDTFERLGRVEQLPVIRKDLWERYGVLIATADSGFSDPTSPQGKVFGAFEAMRATEENRIKAHQVLRGKRDLARRGFWPGGPRPFGYELLASMAKQNGREVREGSVLKPHPEEAWIIQLLFERAHETGHGQTRLAQYLNGNREIPDKFKPFYGPTIGWWLDQPLYYGELVWEEHSTGVVDDARVLERNPEDQILRIPDFCQSLVSRSRPRETNWSRDWSTRSRSSIG